MKIEELTPGLPITIVANIGEEQLSFSSQIEEVHPRKHIVLASAVFHSEKVITFHAKGLIIDLLLPPVDDRPQIFVNVSLKLVRHKNGTLYYNITTPLESKPFNRRSYFRCFVGQASSVRHGTNSGTYPIIIKDISEDGFSFVCKNEVQFQPNQVVHTVLNDVLEDDPQPVNFHLYGIIVRSYELDEFRTVYGCRLNNHVPGLSNYIMKKERIRLKNNIGRLNG